MPGRQQTNSHDPLELLTIPRVAQLWGIDRHRIYKLVQNGELPHIRFGNGYKLRRGDLEEWLRSRTTSTRNTDAPPTTEV